WSKVTEYFATGAFEAKIAHLWYWYYDSAVHLWFLYYLAMFYVAGLVLHYLAQRLPDRIRVLPLHWFGKVVGGNWNVLILAIPFGVFLALMPNGSLQTSTSFVPDLRTFGGYFLFFCFGWLLYLRRELLYNWSNSAWVHCIIGCLLSVVHYLAVRTALLSGETPLTFWVTVVSGAVAVWLFTFGLIGLCLRYLDRPNPVVRYLVDASYWLYLAHLPFTIWIPGLLANYEWSPWVKAMLVLTATTVITVATYDLFVRNTFIGKVLNGRRYSRGLPVLEGETTREAPEAAVPAQ
ncbi:MAG: acyltransferase family protein, partial [Acidobacteriota bacterium]